MIDKILYYDEQLLHFINHDLKNHFFDWLMPLLRNSPFWIPLYIFLVLFILINYKKTGYWLIIFALLTVVCSDLVSSSLIKQNVFRLRPCNNPALSSWLSILVGYRPQSSSFTSSHAANHFALAMFLFQIFKNSFGKWIYLLFLWAGSISYAQMYVGVHYPIDIACGTLIGIFIGYLFSRIYAKQFTLQ